MTLESQALREAAGPRTAQNDLERRRILARLDESLGLLKRDGRSWQALAPAQRAAHSDISALIRSNQDLIMRAIVLDRENEQGWLRRGLVPLRHQPPAPRQRPHYVADLYRRHATA
jgi:hypothetical protein